MHFLHLSQYAILDIIWEKHIKTKCLCSYKNTKRCGWGWLHWAYPISVSFIHSSSVIIFHTHTHTHSHLGCNLEQTIQLSPWFWDMELEEIRGNGYRYRKKTLSSIRTGAPRVMNQERYLWLQLSGHKFKTIATGHNLCVWISYFEYAIIKVAFAYFCSNASNMH